MSDPRLDALARTLGQAGLSLAVGATLRPATLAVSPPPSGSLPRLERDSQTPGVSADIELRSLLGQGGMGAVWLGHQRSLDRPVAVKRLLGPAHTVDATAALLTEARTTGALAHPGIVPVHALGLAADGSPMLVMKPIEGPSLASLAADPTHPAWPELIRRHGDPVAAYVEILMRVADALEFAHARGFVHRDVKPENVMVGSLGETYLLDWGVALRPDRPSASVSIVGTPTYMAPEMARGSEQEIDARTDVYLLGATLHAVLTGTPRHAGQTIQAVLVNALDSSPVSYDETVPAALGALANQATAADPALRPQSAGAFRQALADFLRHRASLRLAEEAQRLLATDDLLLARRDGESTRLLEARLGFAMALREWRENPLARDGLRRTLLRSIELELDREGLASARELAAQLEPPEPDMEARIGALASAIEERRAHEQAGRAEARERDPRVAARDRAWLWAGITISTLLITGSVAFTMVYSGRMPPPIVVALWDVGVLVALVVATIVLRRRLLANRWSRNAMAFVMIGAGSRILTSVLGAVRGDTLESQASYAILVVTVGVGVAALFMTPRLAGPAVLGVLGALGAAHWPALAVPTIVAIVLATIAVLVSEGRRPAGR